MLERWIKSGGYVKKQTRGGSGAGQLIRSLIPLAGVCVTLVLVAAGFVARDRPAGSAEGLPEVVIEKAFEHLQFERPVDIQHPPDGTDRLFVVEQKGVIQVLENKPDISESRIFLDWSDHVHAGHMEEGMLGLAFHPGYAQNGYFFVYYSADNPRRSVLARFRVTDDDPGKADPDSGTVIMEIPQPYGNHNGGQLAFGPDGYLYISLGDGGAAGDPHGHGQNRATRLGSLLRIDVDRSAGGRPYAIPPDNPYAGNDRGWREEIYAYGLRNPWRFSFDPGTGRLWAGDVGQDKPYEEVNLIEKGGNYGWNIMEGFHCFRPPEGCNREGLIPPVLEYTLENGGRSITGGHVYRGRDIPALDGYYFYGDFVSGRVWAMRYDPAGPPENYLVTHNPNLYPSSFGVDRHGEIYISSFDGRIYQIKGGN